MIQAQTAGQHGAQSTTMRELYVYYRIGRDDSAASRRQVQQLFDQLRQQHPGLQTRLLRRPPQAAGPETWMEVYTHPQGVSAQLHAAIDAASRHAPQARLGERHAEVFEDLAVPAAEGTDPA